MKNLLAALLELAVLGLALLLIAGAILAWLG